MIASRRRMSWNLSVWPITVSSPPRTPSCIWGMAVKLHRSLSWGAGGDRGIAPMWVCAGRLAAAELRLLPSLATHLSVPEIAAGLVLSRHTIKSRMKSIYRKLNGSTRNEVVTRGRDLGLLEG
jgi:DNA-binding CsgD family transcriptional regulator